VGSLAHRRDTGTLARAEETPGFRDTFEFVFALVAQLDVRTDDEVGDGARDEHVASASGGWKFAGR
jgi:hypothetical protein